MATKHQSSYQPPSFDDLKIEHGGTNPEGRPQPGAGNAGDQDRPRKSPSGPKTAEEKSALAAANKTTGKRTAAKKVSRARGRKAARGGRLMKSSGRVGKKLCRKKERDSSGWKWRVR